eukprot:m.48364 g.48364  ORF g.48364 m.48364 type:complete len:313 (+) comp17786_c0_seq1:395-1333(+)
MNAISSSFLAHIKSGDHMVLPAGIYGGVAEWLDLFAPRLGIEVTFVDATNVQNYKEAFQPNTKIVYAETPCNPTMRITDLKTLGELKAEYAPANALLMVDATFGTPYNQRVLDFEGCDVAIHSATKYFSGHSDLLAGAVSSKDDDFMLALGKTQKLFGGISSAFDCFLLQRGLKTFYVRMERINRTASFLAEFLDTHPKIEVVHYPGLPSHPDNAIAREQMIRGFGGMISFDLVGGEAAGRQFVESLNLVSLAVSLGGVESLIEHPASMTHAMVSKAAREKAGLTDGLIRFSPGLEDPEDIRQDFEQALAKL